MQSTAAQLAQAARDVAESDAASTESVVAVGWLVVPAEVVQASTGNIALCVPLLFPGPGAAGNQGLQHAGFATLQASFVPSRSQRVAE